MYGPVGSRIVASSDQHRISLRIAKADEVDGVFFNIYAVYFNLVVDQNVANSTIKDSLNAYHDRLSRT